MSDHDDAYPLFLTGDQWRAVSDAVSFKLAAAHEPQDVVGLRGGLGPAILALREELYEQGARSLVANHLSFHGDYEGEQESFIPYTFSILDMPSYDDDLLTDGPSEEVVDEVIAIAKVWSSSERVAVTESEDPDLGYMGGTYRVTIQRGVRQARTFEIEISENMGLNRIVDVTEKSAV